MSVFANQFTHIIKKFRWKRTVTDPGAISFKNAKYLADGGGAVIVEDKKLQAENFASTVLDLLNDPAKLSEMSKAARALSSQDAAARIRN